ncbi:class III extradiol ring-cleavage dioxygenase [Granulosicoccaceae sp. 1_MG-2023]|nr:class III extradiol ring-cleavage dioxygenase [Granulosicoccaceae sp. 1_MG-2023]
MVLPSLYLSHGSPMLALDDTPTTRFWQSLPQLAGPALRGIVCISAHWHSEVTTVTGGHPDKPVLHDFYGFPPALYQQHWQMSDARALAQQVTEHLNAAGVQARHEPQRPIDHGAWVPMRFAWPAGELPLVQVSLNQHADGGFHWQLGEALAPLREQGLLIVGSGSIAHNLRLLQPQVTDERPGAEAEVFVRHVQDAVNRFERQRLCDWPSLPLAARYIPTPEHYYPLLVATGAARGDKPRWLHESWSMRELDLFAVCFGGQA